MIVAPLWGGDFLLPINIVGNLSLVASKIRVFGWRENYALTFQSVVKDGDGDPCSVIATKPSARHREAEHWVVQVPLPVVGRVVKHFRWRHLAWNAGTSIQLPVSKS